MVIVTFWEIIMLYGDGDDLFWMYMLHTKSRKLRQLKPNQQLQLVDLRNRQNWLTFKMAIGHKKTSSSNIESIYVLTLLNHSVVHWRKGANDETAATGPRSCH